MMPREENVSKLKAMRLLRKLKLRELAALCGVTAATVHDTETGGIEIVRIAKRYAA
jgi:transcriptional regulator with XRE-family HTH domain